MEAVHELTETQIREVFKRWNKAADEGNWHANPADPEKQAREFLNFAEQIRNEGR